MSKNSFQQLLPLLGFLWMLNGSAQVGLPEKLAPLMKQTCFHCHDKETAEGGLDLTSLSFDPSDRSLRDRWIRIHDRIEKGEMPPKADDLPPPDRAGMVKLLAAAINDVDHGEVVASGRGPIRRLNRDEYEQNLRDVLQLPNLDIRDMLPEDREGHRFNKTTDTLDISRVQFMAYLDAAESGLRQALAGGIAPPPVTRYQALATRMFQEAETFGNREAMFYAKDSKLIDIDGKKLSEIRQSGQHDPTVEMALFRSAHWPYYGYPEGFIAKLPGEYKVRFSARAVLQMQGHELKPATQPVPMTFRARQPSGPDVSGDVRATGGIIDIQPEVRVYETTVRLLERETFEYSLLGLPVPLARNVNNGPPTYRYPPLPEGGQPGVAFQSIEIEGPISSPTWPPPSHRVLFDGLPIRASESNNGLPVEVVSQQPLQDGPRLLRRFVNLASRQPVPDEALQK